ncbi:helix-turn-helix domain-containing protein [Flavobacterium rhizosphaerae]|uniref:Helix-turn-helix transcriptional regulator n=1 Tax=Flavobacterium rhizosphaerae TaxID=3163298 RepID=A0ABW8YZA9_9FLAO
MTKLHTSRIKTISEFHQLRGLPKPEHPLISIVDYKDIVRPENFHDVQWILDFYQISLKRGIGGKIRYGQQQYDFDEGIMFFISPNQVFRIESAITASGERSGWMLLIHPDFLWRTSLAKTISRYDFFSYSVNEALFLSDKEERTIDLVLQSLRDEYHGNIDRFSQNIIISHIETLLNYSERFYERQFITRQITNHQILERLESLLVNYFNGDSISTEGLPSVQIIAQQLSLSPNYLSRVLKGLTGQSTQQFIHDKIIDKAKNMLSTTDLSVSEIAYELGFEHPQSFNKLFKSKTQQSPIQFRSSFKL